MYLLFGHSDAIERLCDAISKAEIGLMSALALSDTLDRGVGRLTGDFLADALKGMTVPAVVAAQTALITVRLGLPVLDVLGTDQVVDWIETVGALELTPSAERGFGEALNIMTVLVRESEAGPIQEASERTLSELTTWRARYGQSQAGRLAVADGEEQGSLTVAEEGGGMSLE